MAGNTPECGLSKLEEEQYLIDSSKSSPKDPLSARLYRTASVVIICLLYLLIGPSLIIINRTLMKERNFNYPMAISGLGLLFSSAVSFFLVHGGCVRRENAAMITRQFCVCNLVPIGASLATTLATGNAVYLYLPVGFIQMLKAFTPTVTLTLLWLFGIEVPSVRVLCTVVGICAGTALASFGHGSLNLVGLALMLAAEVSEALRLVLTQKLLTNLKFGVIEGQYYMAPISALWLFSAAAVTELPRALHPVKWAHAMALVASEPWLFASSAALGFAVNLCTFLVIKSTNAVTLKVLGTTRNAGLVLFSAVWYGEHISELEAAGYGLSLLFFFAYNFVKMRGQ
mmetsp:Transcript_26219/g.66583  ORF Transcript_26219/g.66583 Transcript_26219/m.66583 type:complete len:342 (-) Transcript_26219:390-1415(-)